MTQVTHTLTKEEQEETIFVTIGRLRRLLHEQRNPERQIALFEKIVKRVEQMDIDLPVDKRETF